VSSRRQESLARAGHVGITDVVLELAVMRSKARLLRSAPGIRIDAPPVAADFNDDKCLCVGFSVGRRPIWTTAQSL